MNQFNKLVNAWYVDTEQLEHNEETNDATDYIARLLLFKKGNYFELISKEELAGLQGLLQNNIDHYDDYVLEIDHHNYFTHEKHLKSLRQYVYVIFDKQTKLCKIGYTSRSVKDRLAEIKMYNPTVESWGCLQVYNKNIEKKLHEYFKDKNVRGEWFSLSPDDVDLINYLVEFHNQNVLNSETKDILFNPMSEKHDFKKWYENKIKVEQESNNSDNTF